MPQIHPQISTCAKMGTEVSRATLGSGAAALPSPRYLQPQKRAATALCGRSPPQKITCSAPHCFSHSLLISVDLQALGCTLSRKWKSTERMISAAFVLDILRLVLWHMIGVGEQKHKAAAPVYCEQAVLSTSAFLFMSRHTTCQATWIRN